MVPFIITSGFQVWRVSETVDKYSASTEILLRARSTDGSLSGVSERVEGPVLESEVRIIEGAGMQAAVSKTLGFSQPANSVFAEANLGASTVTITVIDKDPGKAAKIANAFGEQYIADRRDRSVADLNRLSDELTTRIEKFDKEILALGAKIANADTGETDVVTDEAFNALRSRAANLVRRREAFEGRIDALSVDASLKTGGAQVLVPAVPAEKPFSPTPVRSIAIGMLGGLILGLALAFGRDILDQRIRTRQDLLAGSPGSPLLAAIPKISRASRRQQQQKGVLAGVPKEATESYRSLRAALAMTGADRRFKTVAVTSAGSGHGSTTTIVHLAQSMSQAGMSVLVVDADMRHPNVHRLFGLPNDVGLSTVLSGVSGISAAAHTLVAEADLTVLTSGPVPANAGELIASERAASVFNAVRQHFDVVLIDTPAVSDVADSLSVAEHVDAIVLVVGAGKANVPQVSEAIAQLSRPPARLIGLVLNGARKHDASVRGSRRQQSRRNTRPVPVASSMGVWVPDESPIWTADGESAPWTPEPKLNGSGRQMVVPNDLRDLTLTLPDEKR